MGRYKLETNVYQNVPGSRTEESRVNDRVQWAHGPEGASSSLAGLIRAWAGNTGDERASFRGKSSR